MKKPPKSCKKKYPSLENLENRESPTSLFNLGPLLAGGLAIPTQEKPSLENRAWGDVGLSGRISVLSNPAIDFGKAPIGAISANSLPRPTNLQANHGSDNPSSPGSRLDSGLIINPFENLLGNPLQSPLGPEQPSFNGTVASGPQSAAK